MPREPAGAPGPCGGPDDVHEIIPRSAWAKGYLVDENCILVCRRHHDWIGDNPAAAHELGLHGFSWERPTVGVAILVQRAILVHMTKTQTRYIIDGTAVTADQLDALKLAYQWARNSFSSDDPDERPAADAYWAMADDFGEDRAVHPDGG